MRIVLTGVSLHLYNFKYSLKPRRRILVVTIVARVHEQRRPNAFLRCSRMPECSIRDAIINGGLYFIESILLVFHEISRSISCGIIYHFVFVFAPFRFPLPFNNGRSTFPVCDRLTAATSSGVPEATTRPPCAPPSGPRSMM